MNSRQLNLESIRPIISAAKVNDAMKRDERFQNMVLRPVIKLQNDLFIEVFKNYVNKHKCTFYDLSVEKKISYIENSIQRDVKFRNSLKGIVIGLFTVEEYLLYIQNSSALNKRMMGLVKNRLISNIQLFERPEYLNAV
jgi:hypothetical protein